MKKLCVIILFYFLFLVDVFAIEFNKNFLNQFDGVAFKIIKKSETSFSNSNKNKSEFNGVKDFREILGNDKHKFNTKVIYITDEKEIENNIITTWYNYGPSNKKQYYLYYQKSEITSKFMNKDDLMLLGKMNEDNLMIIIFQKNSKRIKELTDLLNIDDIDFSDKKDKNMEVANKEKQPVITEEESKYTDTSNLKEYNDIKIYKNTKTDKIVILGKANKIKDGDTITISELFNVRMLGIDAPESKQICRDENKKEYNCGVKSAEYLRKLIGKQNITCVNNGNEKYGRFLFVCKNHRVGDINKEMVRSGWAVSYFSDLYKKDEEYAKQHKLGIWSGSFQMPSEWRKQNKRRSN